MANGKTIEALLAGAAPLADCVAARAAWVTKTTAAWEEAQRAMDKRCMDAVDRISEEEFERLFDVEQAKVDLFRKPLKDAAERDVWPRELYLGGI